MRYLTVFFLLWMLLWPQSSAAQQALTWREQTTTYFAILYPDGYESDALRYAAFVDDAYRQVTDSLGYRPDPPLTLRIYPTMDIYRQVNPLAEALVGVIAHAHTGRREISIALPLLANATEEDVLNVVRHELTHIIAAELSNGQLSTMWQEGIAQYVEQPAPFLDQKLGFLRSYYAYNRLESWSNLDSPGVMYNRPDLGYPQSWSMVSFLVDTYGMTTFIDFLEASQVAGGYRSALQSAYGQSSSELEAAWLAQLPSWLNQGVQEPISSGVNVQAIQSAIEAGRYADALSQSDGLLASVSDVGTRNQLEILQSQAQRGLDAQNAAEATRSALLRGEYDQAEQQLIQARTGFSQLGRADVEPILNAYAERIQTGRQGYERVATAQSQLKGFRWGAARSSAGEAAAIFAGLGDAQGQKAAQLVIATLNQRTKYVGLAILVLVVLGLAWNVDRRRAARRRALPVG